MAIANVVGHPLVCQVVNVAQYFLRKQSFNNFFFKYFAIISVNSG